MNSVIFRGMATMKLNAVSDNKTNGIDSLCISNKIRMICVNISKLHVNKCFNLQRSMMDDSHL